MASIYTLDTFFGSVLSVVLKYVATVLSVVGGIYLLQWHRKRNAKKCSVRQYDERYWQIEHASDWENEPGEDVSSVSFRLFNVSDGSSGFVSVSLLPGRKLHTVVQFALRRDSKRFVIYYDVTRSRGGSQETAEITPALSVDCTKAHAEWKLTFNGTARLLSGLKKADKIQLQFDLTWTSECNPIMLNSASVDTWYQQWGVTSGKVEAKLANGTKLFLISQYTCLRERMISRSRSLSSQLGCDALFVAFNDASACYIPAFGHAYILTQGKAYLCSHETLNRQSYQLALVLKTGKQKFHLLCDKLDSDDWLTRKVVVAQSNGKLKKIGGITTQTIQLVRTNQLGQQVTGLACQEVLAFKL